MHAESQIDAAEATRLMITALHSPEHRATYELVRACAIGTQEMLGRWMLQTPEGPMHRVGLVRMLDGERMGFDGRYRELSDAIAVWDHLYEEAKANGTAK